MCKGMPCLKNLYKIHVAHLRGKNVEQHLSPLRSIGIVRWNGSGNRSARLAQLVERQTVTGKEKTLSD